ncbi:fibronectin type III domain-containing protein [Vallitalea guaymasensis]|uniref:Fibronectin type III domain-containing protein n=1 Tax=Vallitalea guaymasensis TaxID=1185412 RepID=A0A8J8M8R9_9FIRM|nr:fibronectin type III domain-containing protein [Vallitalea guaymasensis]QUH28288.1 fibronectin type III domain-containing protein [Vallitalea guaymasensis]
MKNIKKLVVFITMIIVVGGINVYAAGVGDQLLQPEAGWKRYDDDNKCINYVGDEWKVDSSGLAYGGIQHYIPSGLSNNEVIKCKINFKFVGTQIRFIGSIFDEYTKQVGLKIDGEFIGIFSAWQSDSYTQQSIIAEKTGLEYGTHEVEIYSVDGIRFSCDAIDIDESGELIYIMQPNELVAKPDNDTINLTWKEVSGADSYTILRSTISSSIDTVIASNVTDTTYIDNNVEPEVTYYYVVRAVRNDVESDNSNIASAMIENINTAVIQIKLSTTDVYEYRITMNEVDNFMKWYIDRANGTGLPFYSFSDESKIEPYTYINEYLIFDKIVWFKVKEYIK